MTVMTDEDKANIYEYIYDLSNYSKRHQTQKP